ncbi:hypothetical protein BGZ65_007599, partial [Modicella reniformis]
MRGGVILLLFILWLLSGDDGPRIEILQKALKELQEEVSVGNNRTFGTNISYPLPDAVSVERTKLFNPEGRNPRAHYYHNVSGIFNGDWEFNEEIALKVNEEFPLKSKTDGDPSKNETLTDDNGGANSTQAAPSNTSTIIGQEGGGVTNNVTKEGVDEKSADTIEDNMPKYLEDLDKFRGSFQFNESGTFAFNLKETKVNEYVNWVKGNWRLKHGDNEDYGIALNIQGVHFVDSGSFYMWGIPEDGRMPFWRILDLMPDNASYDLAAAAIKEQYQHRIKTIENAIAGYESLEYPEISISETSTCHYQMYMQLGAINPSVRSSALKDLEREWAAPQGISTIKAPHLNSTLFIYSPNCRLTLVVKNAEGMKREKFYSKAVNYAGMAGTLAFIQVFLLVRQMEYTPTPSSVSKVSYWSIALQVFIDSYLCMLHLTTGVLIDTMPGGLPLPVTAARPAPVEDLDNPRSDMQALYGRFYWMVIVSLIILYKIAISSTRVRNFMISVSALALYSFWVPQIIRNVMRGSKRGLHLGFMMGMTATRLALPIYFLACPENLIGIEPTPWVWGLVLWVALQ